MESKVGTRGKQQNGRIALADAAVQRHSRSADARPERVRELAGFFRLNGPAPSRKFLDEVEDERAGSHAGC